MKNKKTALEWLEENLIGNPHFESDFVHNKNIFIQAKVMEKEQIKDAWMEGNETFIFNGTSTDYFKEQYEK